MRGGVFVSDNEKKKRDENNYLALCMCLGLVFGTAFDQLGLGLCLGLAIGAALDSRKNNKWNFNSYKELDEV